ncbi:MAG: hypothetical protein WBK08_05115 [Nitrospira sp.]
MNKRELIEDNEALRQKLEAVYDLVGDALDLEDEDGQSDQESEDEA